MPFNSFSYKKPRDLNDRNHILNLSAGIRLYLRSRLYNRGRKVRSYTSFFKPDGILPTDGLIKEKIKPILIKEII
jgi:hypothetical protein